MAVATTDALVTQTELTADSLYSTPNLQFHAMISSILGYIDNMDIDLHTIF
jgi:hypothetical protein